METPGGEVSTAEDGEIGRAHARISAPTGGVVSDGRAAVRSWTPSRPCADRGAVLAAVRGDRVGVRHLYGLLVFSPATVSTPIVLRELAVLGVGLTLLLAVNAFLLRATLRPLDGLTALRQRVDLLRPGQRAEADGVGDVANLIRSFNQMLDRLEAERGASAAQALAAQEGERQRIAPNCTTRSARA